MEAVAAQSLAARACPHRTGFTASFLHMFHKVTRPKLEFTCLNSCRTFIEHLDALGKVTALHVTNNTHNRKKKEKKLQFGPHLSTSLFAWVTIAVCDRSQRSEREGRAAIIYTLEQPRPQSTAQQQFLLCSQSERRKVCYGKA